MLGDAPAGTLADIAAKAPDRDSLLQTWKNLLALWQTDPASVTATQIEQKLPGVRAITLPTSGLVITYGELNSLPDFFANQAAVAELPAATLLPILQTVRQEGYNKVDAMLRTAILPTSFTKALISP